MRIDTEQTGIEAFFKPHEILALENIEALGPIGTREVWEKVNDTLSRDRGETISRASIINFMEALRKKGLISGTLKTGKGGKRFEYSIIESDLNILYYKIAVEVIEKLDEAFPTLDFYPILDALKMVKERQ